MAQEQAASASGINAPIFNPGYNRAVLTFDDGPDPVWTPRILAKLREYHVKAIFFLIGEHAKKYPYLVRAIAADGHIIGNHTWHHLDLARVSPADAAKEIDRTNSLIRRATGATPILFRPPYGVLTDATLDIVAKRGMRTVMWNTSTSDYEAVTSAEPTIVRAVMGNATNGTGLVILMHDAAPMGMPSRAATVNALDQVITKLQAKGYTFTKQLPPADAQAPLVVIKPAPRGESLG